MQLNIVIESEKKVKRFLKIPLFPLQGQSMSVFNHMDRKCLVLLMELGTFDVFLLCFHNGSNG